LLAAAINKMRWSSNASHCYNVYCV